MNSTDPLSQALPGYLYEYDGSRLVVVASLFIGLEFAVVFLRFYSRSLKDKKTQLDDVLMWFSLVVCVGLNVLSIVMVKYAGVGRHLKALGLLGEGYKIFRWAKCLIAAGWLYVTAVTLPKLCVLVLYVRIFDSRFYRWACVILATLMIVNSLISGLVGTLGCRPLSFLWDKSILGGKCININLFFRWVSFPNIVTDFAVLVLPLPMVWNLHTSRNQKVGLLLTFGTASVGLIASIVRFQNFFHADAVTDGTMASAELMIWTVVEPGMCLIAACLLRLGPLLQKAVRGTFLDSSNYENSRNYYFGHAKRSDFQLSSMGSSATSRYTPDQLQPFTPIHDSGIYELGKGEIVTERPWSSSKVLIGDTRMRPVSRQSMEIPLRRPEIVVTRDYTISR
ncbi:hypothetical protein BJ875DRAFT_216408 [Amylocarpus encephaloides]|uniref:Rhodopsin domain-containing protein n=1 Tax=Amylocarpus encephaloides TaxID=45428 RepID=A0A9P8C1B0_9HELO|nr:hypothetical protein BJ875DRAFT_216408 [Amylocarpus encephaloides]